MRTGCLCLSLWWVPRTGIWGSQSWILPGKWMQQQSRETGCHPCWNRLTESITAHPMAPATSFILFENLVWEPLAKTVTTNSRQWSQRSWARKTLPAPLIWPAQSKTAGIRGSLQRKHQECTEDPFKNSPWKKARCSLVPMGQGRAGGQKSQLSATGMFSCENQQLWRVYTWGLASILYFLPPSTYLKRFQTV